MTKPVTAREDARSFHFKIYDCLASIERAVIDINGLLASATVLDRYAEDKAAREALACLHDLIARSVEVIDEQMQRGCGLIASERAQRKGG